MHQNAPLLDKKSKQFLWRGHSPPPQTPPRQRLDSRAFGARRSRSFSFTTRTLFIMHDVRIWVEQSISWESSAHKRHFCELMTLSLSTARVKKAGNCKRRRTYNPQTGRLACIHWQPERRSRHLKIWKPFHGPPLVPQGLSSFWDAPFDISPPPQRNLTHCSETQSLIPSFQIVNGCRPAFQLKVVVWGLVVCLHLQFPPLWLQLLARFL